MTDENANIADEKINMDAPAGQQVPSLALFLQQQSQSATAKVFQDLAKSYRKDYFKAIAELQMVRDAVAKVVGGNVMPTPKAIMSALCPDHEEVEVLAERFEKRGFA